jgi:hypothetical protein
MIEDKRAKAIYNAAIYAARSEGKSKEVKGGLVPRHSDYDSLAVSG